MRCTDQFGEKRFILYLHHYRILWVKLKKFWN